MWASVMACCYYPIRDHVNLQAVLTKSYMDLRHLDRAAVGSEDDLDSDEPIRYEFDRKFLFRQE